MARRVTATEAKATLLALLDDVAAEDEVEITKHDRKLVMWLPLPIPSGRRMR